ncbi:MAG: hypothetical protein COW65_14230 [Cytophagales bacterium CG18_big_fil_WC_8_21_14_2_50_42_9]|nr:MAG: hypothetical protein COW65_14230 [Cytophagales bacterium CG18_big_fil_WC_8_21_14_2_50_42_9]
MKNDELRQDGTDRLVALGDLKDYKVAKDSPDVAGWRVIGANGESLGLVKDLIVDLQAMKTRYLSVVADRKYFNTNDDQYMLIPIGAAALDKKGRNVFVSHLDAKSIVDYPVYPGGPIREDYEYAVRDNFLQNKFVPGNPGTAATTDTSYTETSRSDVTEAPVTSRSIASDFYDNNHYNENQFYTSNRDTDRNSTILYTSNQDAGQSDQAKSSRPVTPVFTDNSKTSSSNTPDSTPKSVEESIATIERLEQLRERGSITDEEFRALKRKALNL